MAKPGVLGRFPSQPLAKYPHLAGSDIPVWDAFIRHFAPIFDSVDYDYHVGQGLPPLEDATPKLKKMWLDLTQKRIDVVGYRPGESWVIEVKFRPNLSAVGQALGGAVLFEPHNPEGSVIIPTLVADVIEPDIETFCRAHGVRFFDLSDGHHFFENSKGVEILDGLATFPTQTSNLTFTNPT